MEVVQLKGIGITLIGATSITALENKHVTSHYNRWKGTYRMTYSQFTILLAILSPYTKKQIAHLWEPMPRSIGLHI